MDSSFLGLGGWLGWIGLLGESAMVRMISSEPDRSRPDETDDSGANAACPSRRRGARHIYRQLPSCIPSRWDGTGRPTEAWARETACTNPTRRLPLSALRYQPIHFAPKLFHRRLQSRAPRVDDDVPVRRDIPHPNSNRFSQSPLRAVTHHSLSEGAWHREAQPRPLLFAPRNSQAKRRKVRARNPAPLVIRFAEIRSSQNTSALRETEASRQSGQLFRR
jgi:hypothetical protein